MLLIINIFVLSLYSISINQLNFTAATTVNGRTYRGERKVLKREQAQLKEILSICKTISSATSTTSNGSIDQPHGGNSSNF